MSTKPHGAVGKTIAAGQAAHERLCASSDPIVSGHAKAMGHESPATAILDLAERVKGQRPREPLTITEALMSLRESLERSGMSLGALSDLEDAIRHLQAKPDPTDAIVRFLRAEEERFDRGSEDADLGVEGRERCRNKASALRTVAAYIERGDHLTADTASGETEHERGRQEGRREAIGEAAAMLRAEHAVGSIGTLDFVARLIEKHEAKTE